jgi:hypothetical protein
LTDSSHGSAKQIAMLGMGVVSMGSFYRDAAFDAICYQHTHVLSVDSAGQDPHLARGPSGANVS